MQENLFKEYEGVFDEWDIEESGIQNLESGKTEGRKKEAYNPFAIADAVGKKSAKESWIEYRGARLQGGESEELHARAISKIRDIIIASKEKQENTTMHPFVYKKAKWDLKNWKEGELEKTYTKFVEIYHLSRMGGDELDIAMEKMLLGL